MLQEWIRYGYGESGVGIKGKGLLKSLKVDLQHKS